MIRRPFECVFVSALIIPSALAGAPDPSKIGWSASGTEGAVAAGKPEAVAAGLSILLAGGNAADAAVATLLALSITDYGSFAIGAEVPILVYSAARKEVKVLSGMGGAPLDPAAVRWYMEHGIPTSGMKSAAVPAAPSACFAALKLFGTVSFEQAAAPALALLDVGREEWHPDLARTFRRLIERERETSGTREEKLQAARDRFYKGDIAAELEAWYIEQGGFLRKADLAAHETRLEDPVTAAYRGYTVCKCGPWTQGPYACQTLRLLEGFDLKSKGHLSADHIHLAVEAMKLALADRDEHYGDPLFVKVPMAELLSDEYTALRRPLIDPRKASRDVRPGDPIERRAIKGPGTLRPGPGGTTTCCVADRWGNVVAATPSGNPPYLKPGKTGVTHATRLSSLNTLAGHPNCIAPGKRPRITLTPTLVLKGSRPVFAVSVAGGDLQDQVTLNLLLDAIDFGMMPAEAVRAPRFSTEHHQDSFDPSADRKAAFKRHGSLRISQAVPQAVAGELKARGHDVSTTPGPIGHPVMLYLDEATGRVHAAGDPQAGRHAGAADDFKR
ncbi:MAG: gamma-glutamyltransferase [Planctomycetes bacterium]|nr:gamma-glutamyltransferase [Planctomycetota bacterium]